MFTTFHEHIIRVSHGPQDGISASDFWDALMEYVHKPQEFVEHLSASEILERNESENGLRLRRQLHFSNVVVTDTVDVHTATREIVTMVDGTADFPPSSFVIKLEEPEADNLFVRFLYEEEARNENPMFEDVRKQAYQDKDEFLVRELLQRIFQKHAN